MTTSICSLGNLTAPGNAIELSVALHNIRTAGDGGYHHVWMVNDAVVRIKMAAATNPLVWKRLKVTEAELSILATLARWTIRKQRTIAILIEWLQEKYGRPNRRPIQICPAHMTSGLGNAS